MSRRTRDGHHGKKRMTTPTQRTHTFDEEAYLQQLELMREEIGRSMQAVAGNSLSEFEESLWRQEVLCVSLRRLVRAMVRATPSSSALARIFTVTTELCCLNQTYAHLIQQTRASCDLMYGLCRSYSESSSRDSSGVPAIHPPLRLNSCLV